VLSAVKAAGSRSQQAGVGSAGSAEAAKAQRKGRKVSKPRLQAQAPAAQSLHAAGAPHAEAHVEERRKEHMRRQHSSAATDRPPPPRAYPVLFR